MVCTRREFIVHGVPSTIAPLTLVTWGRAEAAGAGQAHSRGVHFVTLDPDAVKTLEVLGEALLPGSVAAGLAHYLDHQLSGEPADSTLIAKYLRVPVPFADFYRGGLRGVDAAARTLFTKSVADLDRRQANTLVTQLASNTLPGWHGPPQPLFYFVLRNDAIDVLYGTPSGFQELDVPYMPHILPPSPWGK